MYSKEFAQKLEEQTIKNGTIFNVFKGVNFIGQVGVIRDTIVYLDFKNNVIPVDLLTGEYKFDEVKEE